MKALLIDPHWKSTEGYFGPNVGIGYIGAALQASGVEVETVDFLGSDLDMKDLRSFQSVEDSLVDRVKRIIVSEDFALVGITCTIGAYGRSIRIIDSCKQVRPDIPVIVGGAHPTLMDMTRRWKEQMFVDSPGIDIIVRGEGEYTIRHVVQVLQTRRFDRIPGITFRRDGELVRNPDRPLIEELDSIPFPAWHLFELKRYPSVLYVVASRGCTHDCVFCDEPLYWKKRLRWRSAENVCEELESNINKYGVMRFRFTDASFGANPAAVDICRAIRKRRLDIAWNAFLRVDEVDRDLLQSMKDAGCVLLEVGIESGNLHILKRMRKGFSTEHIRNAVDIAKQVGIGVRGSFVLGFPGETRETAEETIEFAKSLDLEAYSWHALMPSVNMLISAAKWGIRIGEIDWKDLNADVPDQVLGEYLAEFQGLIYEPHTASRLAHQDPQVSIQQGQSQSYGSLTLAEISKMVVKAVNETRKPANDRDFFGL